MTSKLKGKIPKKQQVYNKFLFDSHMDILRAEELQEKEIAELKGTLKQHGEAHMAQDILPQFTLLVKTVEHHTNKISDVEECNAEHYKRLADHDESIEALSETVDQLSTCKCEAGAGMLKRIAELERQNTNALKAHRIRGLQMAIIIKRLEEREEIVEQLQISRSAEMLYENEANKRLEGLRDRIIVLEHQDSPSNDNVAALEKRLNSQSEINHELAFQIAGIETRLSRAQDMIAEMHKEGFIQVKQPQRKRMQSP
jgi:chromosome segregation ATPase